MTEENTQNNQNIYQCKECGLHYKNKELAEKCEAWCKEHKTCNVEIMKHSEENKVHQRDPASLILELDDCESKCEEYLNNWKRAVADMANYKKDEAERAGILIKYSKEDIFLNILPIIDSIYLAEKHSDILENVRMSEWWRGFEQIKKQIEEFLKKEGIEEIKTVGEKFDPETMEAVALSSDLSAEDLSKAESLAKEERSEPSFAKATEGTVVEELQKGYIMNEKVLRPAKVKISK